MAIKLNELPGKTSFINPFMRHGWKTVEDVIAAVELNGVSKNRYLDYLTVNNHSPRNAGKKSWAWLFQQLDDLGYDWRMHQTDGQRPYNVPREVEQLKRSMARLVHMYHEMPEPLRVSLFGRDSLKIHCGRCGADSPYGANFCCICGNAFD